MDVAILIDTPALAVTHTGRVLKEPAARRVVEASALLDEARQAAEALLREARQEAEAQRQQAAQALEREKQRGWQAGWDAAQAALAERLAEAAAARQVALHALAPELVEMVLDATAKVIRGVERRHLFARALESVEESLRQASWAQLRVAPAQLAQARAALDAAGQGVVSLVNLVADPSLGDEDAVLESDRGVCHASLAIQLAALEGALQRALQAVPAPQALVQGQDEAGATRKAA